MKRIAFYANLTVVTLVLVGSVALYATGTGLADATPQLRAAGSYASTISLYALGALMGLLIFRRAKLAVRRDVRTIARAVTVLFVVTALVAIVPYLLPNGPQGVTLPAMLLWTLFAFPVSLVGLGFVYALSWVPAKEYVADDSQPGGWGPGIEGEPSRAEMRARAQRRAQEAAKRDGAEKDGAEKNEKAEKNAKAEKAGKNE